MDFSRDIQLTLSDCYNNYRNDKRRLTIALHKKYRRAFLVDSDSCGNVLVPLSDRCLKDIPVFRNKWGFSLEYRFPEPTEDNKYPEFCENYIEDAIIEEGEIIDRIGSEHGRYASPVPKERSIFSATERAIPYWFLADKLEKEPSYHRYKVKKTISRSNLIATINGDPNLSETEKRFMLEEIEDSTIVYGGVAPVDAFGKQGYGQGKQYSFCVKIDQLLRMKFIEEE